MGIRNYSNILLLEYLENTFPDTRTEDGILFLTFLNYPSTGSGQSTIGGSTDGESMTTDGNCDGMNYIKHTITPVSYTHLTLPTN
eukprot:5126046-Ditylum_brightwellii.AAC.3